MREQNLPTREHHGGSGLPDIFSTSTDTPGLATVAAGPYAEQLPVANMTVGEVRARFRDRFDIDPRSQAIIDGNDADDTAVLRAGQVLMFTHRAGEKGTETINIDGSEFHAISQEGKSARMPIESLVAKIAPPRMDTCGVVLPDGLKMIFSEGPITIWVHQSPPRVYSFRWISDNSPAKFGTGTEYKTVRLSLPYLVVFAVFGPGARGKQTLTRSNECFFRNAPLESGDDELLYPALLNCSKFSPPEGKPLSWICTQYLDPSFEREPDQSKRLRLGFRSLLRCLLETGFNYSSEHHESSSWFTESKNIDPRLSAVEEWQAASEKDPLFVLDIPWLKTGHSVRQVAGRILQNHRVAKPVVTTASTLARLIFNHTSTSVIEKTIAL